MHVVLKNISAVSDASPREIEHREASVCARQACATVLGAVFDAHISPERVAVIKDAQGKPSGVFNDEHGRRTTCALSIAHSFPFVLAAADCSDVLLGADVERVRAFSKEFIADLLTDREQAVLEGFPNEEQSVRATEFWSLKEAVLKAVGVGLRVHPRRLEVHELLRGKDGEEWMAYLDMAPFVCRVWQGSPVSGFYFCVVAVFPGDAILFTHRTDPHNLPPK